MNSATKNLLAVFLIGFILLEIWNGCSRPDEIVVEVTVPEQKGEFLPQKPVYIKSDSIVYVTRWRDRKVETANPVEPGAAEAYTAETDSLKRFVMYLNSNELRDFTVDFDDEFISLRMSGQVRGDLKYLKPEYTRKEIKTEIAVKLPPLKNKIFAGVRLGSSTDLGAFQYAAAAGFQKGDGAVKFLELSRHDDQTFVSVGVFLPLIKW